jgi:four helix bundle protein
MAGVRDHTELDVWKLSDELRGRIREVVDRPGFVRHNKLRTQLEEAAESPCPNIAEGFARYLPKDNARFVRIAAGSLAEVTSHLERAMARRLITPAEREALCSLARRAHGAAKGYIVYLESAKPPKGKRKPK